MKRVEVLIPFHMKATDTNHVPGDVIDVSEEQLAKILAVRADMVSVLCDVEEQSEPKPPKKGKTKKQ